jgi:hypothetical protein
MRIIEMCNNIHLAIKHRIIALYNVEFKLFKLKTTREKINGLEILVKNRFMDIYHNDDYGCIFYCLAYHLHTEEYLKTKGDERWIHQIAERIAFKFYGNDFD